jgi:hypothetical protein
VCERDTSLLRTFHSGWSRASPAHGLSITVLTGLLDRLTSIRQRLSPDSDEMPFSCYNYTLLLAGLLLILILVTEHGVPPPPPPPLLLLFLLHSNSHNRHSRLMPTLLKLILKNMEIIIIGGKGQEKDSRLPLCWTYEPARLLAQLWP